MRDCEAVNVIHQIETMRHGESLIVSLRSLPVKLTAIPAMNRKALPMGSELWQSLMHGKQGRTTPRKKET